MRHKVTKTAFLLACLTLLAVALGACGPERTPDSAFLRTTPGGTQTPTAGGPDAGEAVSPLQILPQAGIAEAAGLPPFDHTRFRALGGHSDLDCGACHGLGRSVQCLTCHQPPKAHPGGDDTSCYACHGSNGWRPAGFKHVVTLAAHSTFNCSACHSGGEMLASSVACQICHERPAAHPAVGGQACVQCHSPAAWLPTHFDHSQFTALGKHQGAACASCHQGGVLQKAAVKCETCHTTPAGHIPGITSGCQNCHAPGGWKPASFKHTAFQLVGTHTTVACSSCHADGVYAGRSSACASCHNKPVNHLPTGAGCNQCHTPGGWRPANFVHTSFQLVGRHQTAACSSCHSDGLYAGRSTACQSCHSQPGSHIPTGSTSCSQCHSPGGWKPASFSHTKFALVGRHQSVACSSCHGDGVYSGKSSSCNSCHSQPAGHIPTGATSCSQCHSPAGWKPASFSHTKFALVGRHTSVPCASCHKNGQYAGTPSGCASCHSQPAGHIPTGSTPCSQCHTPNGWKPASFSHTKFALTGRHQSVACSSCHGDGVYAGKSSACSSCHSQPSGHIPTGSTACSQCHTTNGWSGATFSHPFALTGKHSSVPCASCHKNGVYAGTPSGCSSCHTAPSSHGGLTNCAACHTTGGFKPSTFVHKSIGEHMGAGAERPLGCSTCHPSGYTSRNCSGSGCHTSPPTI